MSSVNKEIVEETEYELEEDEEPGNEGTSLLPPWKKECWSTQPYADNYIDETLFLDQLNANNDNLQRRLTLSTVLFNTSTIVQQISIVAIFLSISRYADRSESTVIPLAFFDAILVLLGIILQRILSAHRGNLSESFFSFLLAGIFLRLTAPVLQTLTSGYSSDTVHALSLTLSCIHLVFYDYAFIHTESEFSNGTVSLNAAMFTSVLLASRFKNVQLVVAFVLLAIMLFSELPSIAKIVKKYSDKWYLASTFFVLFMAMGLLYKLDITLLCIFSGVVIFTWLISPVFFLYMQRFKFKKNGPWDIAKLEKRTTLLK